MKTFFVFWTLIIIAWIVAWLLNPADMTVIQDNPRLGQIIAAVILYLAALAARKIEQE